ncbi:hypothetical protein [uncultured Cedecea sp.]|uniref:hypothetical protein n=1 Tax=uncultured Cedecea sp. TaxID=988762 RepID=UPI002625FFEF|nr:hypothetical protein [uncultured Cedecea sp.]
MSDITHYQIPLNGVSPEDDVALKALFEAHAALFDSAILSTYGGDIRYAVVAGSFSVTGLSDGKVNYDCQVNYFAPCHDQNDFFQVQGSANYEVTGENIILKLDETLWNID